MPNHKRGTFDTFRASMLAKTDDWKEIIADDVSLIGPLAQSKGKDSFIQINVPFFASIISSTLNEVVEIDDRIITQISIDLNTPAGNVVTLEVCEWYQIIGGKIVSLRVFFDTHPLLANG